MWRLQTALVVVFGLMLVAGCAPPEDVQVASTPVVPDGRDLGEWLRSAEPEVYVGEELFQLINGGAEMYHEFGFLQVHAAEFELGDQHAISFELFEMTDVDAAYGVFSFKKGSGGRNIDIGDGCVMQDYYLNAWSGRFVLTLTGMADDARTEDGLERIARATVALIAEAPSRKPSIAQALESLEGRTQAVRYLRGDLALSNVWSNGGAPRFFFSDGAETRVDDNHVILLSYESSEAARHHLEKAVDHIIGGDRFVLREDESATSVLVDQDGGILQMAAAGRYINVVSGPDGPAGRALLSEVVSLSGTLEGRS